MFLSLIFVIVPSINASAPSQASSPYDPAQYGLPESLGGYKVLAVLTPDNTACMPAESKRAILQATQGSISDYLKESDAGEIQNELKKLKANDPTMWEVMIVGPNTNLDDFISENQKWNDQVKQFGCVTAFPAATGTNKTEIKINSPHPGYAEFEDINAGSFVDDNAQSVYLVAPATIANRTNAVLLLNNVRTDNSNFYLLQNGLQFWNGNGNIVWTDSDHNYSTQNYNITYVANHTYWAVISFSSAIWQLCAVDTSNTGTYTCAQQSHVVGTTLGLDTNTAVWVENQTTSPTWYQGFSNPLLAYGAQIYRNGVGQNWSSNHRHTLDACTSNWPASSVVFAGTLANGNTGQYKLPGVPPNC